MQNKKIFIYQIFTRLFGNNNPNKVFNGTIEENGSGKLQDISDKAIKAIVKKRIYSYLADRHFSTLINNRLHSIRNTKRVSRNNKRESRLSLRHSRLLRHQSRFGGRCKETDVRI